MYKMVIADDEPAVLRFLQWIIKSYNLPFSICGEGCNGAEAVKFAECYQPDFVILDINMPIMGGLEAARLIKLKYPQAFIYILTAYEYFEYAQTAIKINVEDYLLKPIKPEYLVEILKDGIRRALRNRLECSRRKRMNLLAVKSREDKISKLLFELVGLNGSRRRDETFDLRLRGIGNVSWVFAGSLWGQGEIKEYLLQALARVTKHLAIVQHTTITPGGQIIVLGMGQSGEILPQLQRIVEGWCASSSLQVSANLVFVDNEIGVANAVLRAVQQVQVAQFWEESGLNVDPGLSNLLAQPPEPEDYGRQFISSLLVKGADAATIVLENLIEKLREKHCSREHLLKVMADLITLIIHDVAEFVSEEYTNALRYKLQEQMDGVESITPIRQTLSDFTRSLATNICGTGESLAQRSVKWAVQFIQHNYQADLNLELIAGKLYLSPCYFSRIFKKYTGQGFSNYLTSFRMRKAKSLLATGKYTVAEVARYIGIQDASYFCSVFKKYHLVTPRQIVGEYIRQEI